MIPDLIQRFNHLVELHQNPKIVNEDGSQVNPLLEITAEAMNKPANQVTMAELTYVRSFITTELAKRSFKPGGFFG